MKITAATPADWPQIERIYREGIRTKLATFETEDRIPDGATWFAGKISDLIFKMEAENGEMLGWAALTPVSSRCVYAGVAEVSIYVAGAARGQGVGLALLNHLVAASEEAGLWTLQAGIFTQNEVSIRLHKKAGFRIVGVREKLGRIDGRWQDIVLMERRSSVVE